MVVFSLGLFVVVFGLKNAGLLEILQIGIVKIMELERFLNLLSIGFLSAFGSSLINNLPMMMLGDLVLKEARDLPLVFAHLLGCNIGSKFHAHWLACYAFMACKLKEIWNLDSDLDIWHLPFALV